MKIKILSALLALSMILAFMTSCATPEGSGGDTIINGSGDNELTNEEKNKMTLAKELTNEVDEVKAFSSAANGDSTSGGSSSGISDKDGKGDRSEIKFENTALIKEESSLDADGSITEYDWADEIISKLKSTKNQALDVCKCLNVWVKIGEGAYSSVYRMNYDANTDTVTVEHHSYPSDFNTYSKFTVTLDREGKAVIDYYSVAYKPDYITDTTELHYYEDKYYFSISAHRLDEGGTHENTMFLDLENKVQASVIVNSVPYFENGAPVRYEYEIPEISFSYTNEKYSISTGAVGGSLYYRSETGSVNGGHIGSYNENGMSLNLSVFDGWTRVSRDGDYVTLSTTEKGDITSIGFTNNDIGIENGVRYSYNIPYYEGYDHAYIFVDFSEAEGLSVKDKLRGAFAVLERELGLSLSGGLKEDFINTSDRHSELLESFKFMNGTYAVDIKTAEDYFAILDAMRFNKLTLDELKKVYDGNGINKNDQVPENSYFEFLSFTLTGKATVNETDKTVSLTAMTAELHPSLMLKDGGEYSLVFAWTAPGVMEEIGSVDVVYDGAKITFVSDITVNTDKLERDFGEYRLVAFIAIKQDVKHERISKLFDVTASANASYEDALGLILSTVTASEQGIILTSVKAPTPPVQEDEQIES